MSFRASAPGSMMLLGEYAVLQGKPSVICAINKRMTVTLTPRQDDRFEIDSDIFGKYETTLSTLEVEKPFQFVLGVLKNFQGKLRHGCNIKIESEFSDKIGLGSSAAVTVATLSAVVNWLNIRMSPLELIRQGKNIVRLTQGVGSGADVAAAVFGGIVSYQAQPFFAERFNMTYPLSALYAGYKTKTADAIKQVQTKFEIYPNLYRHLTNSIGQCASEGIQMLRREDWIKFGEVMNIQQGIMQSIGVSSPLMQSLVEELHEQPTVLGAKISGSGLGDCVIGLGSLPLGYRYTGKHHEVTPIPVEMTLVGVHCEKV